MTDFSPPCRSRSPHETASTNFMQLLDSLARPSRKNVRARVAHWTLWHENLNARPHVSPDHVTPSAPDNRMQGWASLAANAATEIVPTGVAKNVYFQSPRIHSFNSDHHNRSLYCNWRPCADTRQRHRRLGRECRFSGPANDALRRPACDGAGSRRDVRCGQFNRASLPSVSGATARSPRDFEGGSSRRRGGCDLGGA